MLSGPMPEAPGVAVEDGAEDARRVHPRQAQPFDVAARRHQRRRLAVGQEGVVGDRRERRSHQPLRACVVQVVCAVCSVVHRCHAKHPSLGAAVAPLLRVPHFGIGRHGPLTEGATGAAPAEVRLRPSPDAGGLRASIG